MSTFARVKELRQKRYDLSMQCGNILIKAYKNADRKPTREEKAEWEKRMKECDDLAGQIKMEERQQQVDGEMRSIPPDSRNGGREDIIDQDFPGTKRRSPFDKAEIESTPEDLAMRSYLIYGESRMTSEEQDIMRAAWRPHEGMESRALSAITGSAGAYTVPQGFQYNLDVALKAFGGIFETCEVIPTDHGNLLPYPSLNDTANASEIIAENSQVTIASSNTTTPGDPVFGVINFSAWMFDSGIVQLPISLIQDSGFNIEDVLADALGVRMARKINTVCTVGTGINQPTGIINAAATGADAASKTTIAYNDLLNLEHSVDPAYRSAGSKKKAKWMFCDSTLKGVKQLTDSNGRPLFIAGGTAQGIQDAAPDTIDGYQYQVNQDMPAIGTANKSVLFGDLSKYKVRKVRRDQLVRLAERYIDHLQIGYLVFGRYDGNLVDAGTHPVMALQHPTS